MTRFASLFLATALATTAAIGPGMADSPPTNPASVELLTGWRNADGQHIAALRVTLAEGWKTYWRAPGEGGIPPEFDWSGSANVGAVEIHWPVPEVFVANGMTTVGYRHELILPIEITPVDAGADVQIDADLLMGICHDICVPMEAELRATLPESGGADDERIAIALAQRPDTADEAGLVSARCSFAPIADGVRVTALLDLPQVGPGEHAVFEMTDRAIWVSEAVTQRAGGLLTTTADLVPPTAKPFALNTDDLRLTVLAGGRAVDIDGCEAAR